MILYFTGTGNSRYVAQRIAERMGDEAHCINDKIREKDTRPMKGDGSLIVVAPTYAWRLPRIVVEWLIKTPFPDTKEAWFVMDCGDGIGAAGRYNRQLCAEKGWIYKGTAQIVMPENYLAMFGTPEKDEAAHIVAAANPVIDRAAARIAAGEGLEEKPSTLLDRMLSGAVNDAFYLLFVKDKAVYRRREMHRLRRMREALSAEEHHVVGRKTALGRQLHALHGLHQLLSYAGD